MYTLVVILLIVVVGWQVFKVGRKHFEEAGKEAEEAQTQDTTEKEEKQ